MFEELRWIQTPAHLHNLPFIHPCIHHPSLHHPSSIHPSVHPSIHWSSMYLQHSLWGQEPGWGEPGLILVHSVRTACPPMEPSQGVGASYWTLSAVFEYPPHFLTPEGNIIAYISPGCYIQKGPMWLLDPRCSSDESCEF